MALEYGVLRAALVSMGCSRDMAAAAAAEVAAHLRHVPPSARPKYEAVRLALEEGGCPPETVAAVIHELRTC